MSEVLEFFVPGERVRWHEHRTGYQQMGTVRHDGGSYVAVTPDDPAIMEMDGYKPLVHGAELHLQRVHLTSAAHQGPGLE